MKCFFGILILTGYHRLPRTRFYWASNPAFGIDYVISAMRRNRFQKIIRSLHCVNNILVLDDKLWKFMSILYQIKDKCLEHFETEQNLSFDESMVEYFGRHGCKQPIWGKPIRFGFKVWCLNTVSEYLVGFNVYQGKSLNTPSVYEELFGKSSAPLVKLLDGLPEHEEKYSYRIYFDNLFTNVYLMEYLWDISYYGIGTIREDLLRKDCPLLGKPEMRQQLRSYYELAYVRKMEFSYVNGLTTGLLALLQTAMV